MLSIDPDNTDTHIYIYCVACEAWRHIGITLSGVCLSSSHTFLVVTHSYCMCTYFSGIHILAEYALNQVL